MAAPASLSDDIVGRQQAFRSCLVSDIQRWESGRPESEVEDGSPTGPFYPDEVDVRQRTYDPKRALAQGATLFVNGILGQVDSHKESAQQLAKVKKQPVVGVFNRSEGFPLDLVQCLTDHALPYDLNPAISRIRGFLSEGLGSTLIAHSQGTLILSHALRLQRKFYSREAITRYTVETFANVSPSWPEGPRYTHNVFPEDPVSTFAPAILQFLLPPLYRSRMKSGEVNPMESMRIVHFDPDSPLISRKEGAEKSKVNSHDLGNYLDQYQDFVATQPQGKGKHWLARLGRVVSSVIQLDRMSSAVAEWIRNWIIRLLVDIINGAIKITEAVISFAERTLLTAWNAAKAAVVWTGRQAMVAGRWAAHTASKAWDWTKQKGSQAWQATKKGVSSGWHWMTDRAKQAAHFGADVAHRTGDAILANREWIGETLRQASEAMAFLSAATAGTALVLSLTGVGAGLGAALGTASTLFALGSAAARSWYGVTLAAGTFDGSVHPDAAISEAKGAAFDLAIVGVGAAADKVTDAAEAVVGKHGPKAAAQTRAKLNEIGEKLRKLRLLDVEPIKRTPEAAARLKPFLRALKFADGLSKTVDLLTSGILEKSRLALEWGKRMGQRALIAAASRLLPPLLTSAPAKRLGTAALALAPRVASFGMAVAGKAKQSLSWGKDKVLGGASKATSFASRTWSALGSIGKVAKTAAFPLAKTFLSPSRWFKALQRSGDGASPQGVHADSLLSMLLQREGPGSLLAGSHANALAPLVGGAVGVARIHTGPLAAKTASLLQAEAFTIGQHVFFGEGKLNLGSERGLGLLAHELTHVGQQTQGGFQQSAASMDAMEKAAQHVGILARGAFAGGDSVHFESCDIDYLGDAPNADDTGRLDRIEAAAIEEAVRRLSALRISANLDQVTVSVDLDLRRMSDEECIDIWADRIFEAVKRAAPARASGQLAVQRSEEMAPETAVQHAKDDLPKLLLGGLLGFAIGSNPLGWAVGAGTALWYMNRRATEAGQVLGHANRSVLQESAYEGAASASDLMAQRYGLGIQGAEGFAGKTLHWFMSALMALAPTEAMAQTLPSPQETKAPQEKVLPKPIEEKKKESGLASIHMVGRRNYKVTVTVGGAKASAATLAKARSEFNQALKGYLAANQADVIDYDASVSPETEETRAKSAVDGFKAGETHYDSALASARAALLAEQVASDPTIKKIRAEKKKAGKTAKGRNFDQEIQDRTSVLKTGADKWSPGVDVAFLNHDYATSRDNLSKSSETFTTLEKDTSRKNFKYGFVHSGKDTNQVFADEIAAYEFDDDSRDWGKVLLGVSGGEGGPSSVNTYDNGLYSWGAMQFTSSGDEMREVIVSIRDAGVPQEKRGIETSETFQRVFAPYGVRIQKSDKKDKKDQIMIATENGDININSNKARQDPRIAQVFRAAGSDPEVVRHMIACKYKRFKNRVDKRSLSYDVLATKDAKEKTTQAISIKDLFDDRQMAIYLDHSNKAGEGGVAVAATKALQRYLNGSGNANRSQANLTNWKADAAEYVIRSISHQDEEFTGLSGDALDYRKRADRIGGMYEQSAGEADAK